MSPINERQWQGRVLLKLGQLIAVRPEFGISRVEQEVEVRVSGQRRKYTDPLLYNGEDKPLCLLELKLPDRPDGRSPRYLPVVEATHEKASYLGTPYWLTWNVNSAVLWKMDVPGRPPHERSIRQYDIAGIRTSEDLDRADVVRQVDAFLERFLSDLHNLHVGVAVAMPQPLDESFVHTIQTYIDPLLVGLLQQELVRRYRRSPKFANALRTWAVDDQGWTWDDSPEGLPDSLGRTVRLACSMLVNKLVFYEAMRKTYGLRAVTVPKTIATGADLRMRLQQFFDDVVNNIDYESVFTNELIDEIPFLADQAVELWRDLIQDIARFDFTRLDYEVIGNIFQRLIAPDERHKLGQYFTPTRVVDFINAFCIRNPAAHVFDPGCGAGTFLVRAYSKLKALDPQESHEARLRRLWGADIARYAAHLSVINLAARDLSSIENYPRIIHDDFFRIIPGTSQYPFHERVHEGPGLQRTVRVLEAVPTFQAVVGNPPYTRQEEMEDLFAGMKARAHGRVLGDWGVEISAQAGIHALFLLHGSAFLEEGGRLGFLTHSSWVDVNYGRDLQEFLLQRFKIVAIVEPQVEHWFPGVDVNTSVVIVERCADPAARAANLARFIQVRVPLAELVQQVAGDPDDITSYQRLVQTLEATTQSVEEPYWRILPISQEDLWARGLDAAGHYVGEKWGVYLRAPDVYFEILRLAADRLVRLEEIADVKFALKSGANEFFYVRDVTDDLTSVDLESLGLTRRTVRRLRVIQTEGGDRHVVEAEYLRPIVVSTRQATGLRVQPQWARDRVLMVNEPVGALAGTRVIQYIREGERRPFGTGPRSGVPAEKPTCAARDPWYSLDPRNRGRFWWFMNITNVFAVPHNPEGVYADHRFHNITPKNPDHDKVLFGLLNSTFTLLCAEVRGRQFAGRGIDSLDIQVTEVKDLPILNPDVIPGPLAAKIVAAVRAMSERTLVSIPEELKQNDRYDLDNAVLEAMGFTDAVERMRVLDAMYTGVADRLRIRFERARSTQHGSGGQRRQASATALAGELAAQVDRARLRRFPDDFVPQSARCVMVNIPEGGGEATRDTMRTLRIGASRMQLHSSEAVEFVELAVSSGARGQIGVPTDAKILERALDDYREYLREMEQLIAELAESRTRDRRLQRQIRAALRSRLGISSGITRQLRLV